VSASWEIHGGDCIEVMQLMEACSIDAVVCDPPYGIGFMGHEWDQPGVEMRAGPGKREQPPAPGRTAPRSAGSMEAGKYDLSLTANQRFQAWCEAWACEAFRVLKPGGHMLVSGGTRTYHRLTSGIENAGFEIRDSLIWGYGQGFPKSLDVAKAIEAEARPIIRRWFLGPYGSALADARASELLTAIVARAEAQETHAGEGTALKPGWEPIVVARRPLTGTVVQNVLEHGTGALNIDGCRIGTGDGGDRDGEATATARYSAEGSTNFAATPGPRGGASNGRWPANVALSHAEDCNGECVAGCPVAELDAQSGLLKSGDANVRRESGGDRAGNRSAAYGAESRAAGTEIVSYGDQGGASRFFYCAKASRAERNAGLDDFALAKPHDNAGHEHADGRPWDIPGSRSTARANSHPTVKPIELMRWLVRLVTPPGGVVLDPFTGSGTTGCAAVREGFDFIGIEREAKYAAIARARIAWWAAHPEGVETERVMAADRAQAAVADLGQLSIEDAA
jgi:DNA modification methylase